MLQASDDIETTISDIVSKESQEDLNDMGFGNYSLNTDQKRFVNKMVGIHGNGVLFRSPKNKSIELQLPDPVLLEKDGDKELTSRHLFVNVDKVIKEQHTLAARCVKDGRVYNVHDLLSMLPLEKRLGRVPKSQQKRRVSFVDKFKFMERDANGNLVPPGPGECTPLTELPTDHPCIEYIESRGFRAVALVKQFGAAFCHTENNKVPYKRLPGGFKATPQGRIVFFIEQLGVRRGWQARQLDRVVGDEFHMYHPYLKHWVHVANRIDGADGWHMLPNYDGKTISKPSAYLLKQKYVIGLGVEKSTTLMGFDAAKHYHSNTIGIVEGVLDAARLGPPFCSIMGLGITPNQSALVANHFHRAVCIPDNDEERDNADVFISAAERELEGRGIETVIAQLQSQFKDAGELSLPDVIKLREEYEI